jgi:DNA-binding FadR family transcriptional regulator
VPSSQPRPSCSTPGTSGPALREALRILESEALIEVRRGNVGGALVTMPTVTVAARSAAIILQMEETPLEARQHWYGHIAETNARYFR